MRSKTLKFGEGFRVAFEVRKAQAAEMVIPPGDSEGGPDNRHRGADQWLFVVAGSGQAIVETEGRKRRVALAPGTLLVIEKGEKHEVRNTGRTLLRTLNFYYPPAFAKDGDPKGPGKK
ncbi:cupin domain-containing protein [Lysobacter sp. A6]|uniref:Cupin domain-containing protein n=1 Tax=Noviluteimonas lactosilytica TaxID=2888523 RepID=A0ABS8JFA8_9GAMM|nr:cupin domain-containing protein [Lysobacter lactosilyticus]MCC8362237.1 cupin domain-containing protein [Lysobacter lactosilyticus]